MPRTLASLVNRLVLAASALCASAPAMAADFVFTGQWTGGGQGQFTAVNGTGQPIDGWKLEFDWDADITSIWNSSIQSKVGNHYVVVNAAWNGAVAAGASIDVGCVANMAVPGTMPTSIVFSAAGSGGGSGGGGSGGSGGGSGGATVPAISSSATAVASLGRPFSYQITASGSPSSFAATGLPAGVGVSASSGLISGTPTASGTFIITLRATNSAGTGSGNLSLSVSSCAADGNRDGKVDGSDLAGMLAVWGQASSYDLDADGTTSGSDVALLLGAWGACPDSGTSGGYEKMPSVEQRKIVGYYPNWGIYQKNFPVTSIRGDRVNLINYAFLIPLDRTMPSSWDRIVSSYRGWKYANYAAYLQQPAGTTLSAGVGLFDEWADAKADTAAEALTMSPAYRAGSNFAQLRDLKAANPKLRTMISIGGWTLSTPFFSIARSAQKRADFAKSAVYVTARYGFDGIDIDWEYAGGGGLEQDGIGDPSTDGANYLLLLQALRDELNRQSAIDGRTYYLSIAAPAGNEKIANIDPTAIAGICDWINLMAYDFHGGWESKTGINAPMVNIDPSPTMSAWSVSASIDAYLNAPGGGVPASKLVVGVPFYGRGWDGVSPGPNGDGLGQAGYEASAPVIGGSEFPYSSIIGNGYLALSNGALVGSGGYTRYWNDVAQVPYLYSPAARRFISYDDPQSMRVKMDFANQRGLGGAMFWELSEDTVVPATSLMDTIYQSLKLP